MEGVTPEKAIAVLNEINQLDATVLPALIMHRVPCNDGLAQHPTVQVGLGPEQYEVGFLGIINGIFGAKEDGWGFIAAVYDDDGKIKRFELMT